MKYEHTAYNADLSEITQSLNTTMALAKKVKNGTVTNAHDFVHCRDFLGDALNAVNTKSVAKIYGFTFNGKKDTFIQNSLALIIKFPDKETEHNFLINSNILRQYEKSVKVKEFTFELVSDLTYYVVASKFWLKSVFNLSLYTFMLKSLGYKLDQTKPLFDTIAETTYESKRWDGIKITRETVEAEYARSVLPVISKILPKIKKINLGLPSKTGYIYNGSINQIHNHSGFVTLITRYEQHKDTNIIVKNIAKCLK